MTALYIWVEGPDDHRFFERIVIDLFAAKYDWVKLVSYSSMPQKLEVNFLKSINSMNADYIYITDKDACPCVTTRLNKVKADFPLLDSSRVQVVVCEIEGWYLAGLDENACEKLKIVASPDTEGITKEAFDDLLPKAFENRTDFMLEILKHFQLEQAVLKNASFSHFMNKYVNA